MRVLDKGDGGEFAHQTSDVAAVAYSPDSHELASVGDTDTEPTYACPPRLRRWNLATGSVIDSVKLRTGSGRCVAYSPDGGRLAMGNGNRQVWVYNLDTGEIEQRLKNHSLTVHAVAFSSDGEQLFSGAGDKSHTSHRTGEVFRWDVSHGYAHCLIPPSVGAYTLVVGANPESLLIGSSDQAIHVVDWRTGRDDGMLSGANVFSLDVNSDGTYLAASAGWGVQLWDLETRTRAAVLKGHRQRVNSVSFSPDGRSLASGATDGTIRFWDVATRSQRAVFEWGFDAVLCVKFSPDGLTCAAGGRGEVSLVIWDVE